MTPYHLILLSLAAMLLRPLSGAATEPPITAVAFAPDGKSVVTVSQTGLQVLSWPALERQRTIETSASNLHDLAFSPDGKMLAVGGGHPSEEGIVEVFDWATEASLLTIHEHSDSVTAIAWHDPSQLFSASLDREVKRHDVSARKVLHTYRGHSRGVTDICLLKEQQVLVSVGDDQSVRVWQLSTGELVRSLSQHTKPIHAVTLRPTKQGLPMVASAAGDRTIRFWQPTIGRMIRYVRLPAEPLSVAWTPDGALILAACIDGRVRVVDPLDVRVTHTLPAIDRWAYSISVHPKDESVVVGGNDGQTRRLPLPRTEAKQTDAKQGNGDE